MVKKAKKPKETFPVRKFQGQDGTTHPLWGTGKPILIGDTAEHGELGACTIVEVKRSKAVISDRNKALHTVSVRELWFNVTQVPHLVDVERFGG